MAGQESIQVRNYIYVVEMKGIVRYRWTFQDDISVFASCYETEAGTDLVHWERRRHRWGPPQRLPGEGCGPPHAPSSLLSASRCSPASQPADLKVRFKRLKYLVLIKMKMANTSIHRHQWLESLEICKQCIHFLIFTTKTLIERTPTSAFSHAACTSRQGKNVREESCAS